MRKGRPPLHKTCVQCPRRGLQGVLFPFPLLGSLQQLPHFSRFQQQLVPRCSSTGSLQTWTYHLCDAQGWRGPVIQWGYERRERVPVPWYHPLHISREGAERRAGAQCSLAHGAGAPGWGSAAGAQLASLHCCCSPCALPSFTAIILKRVLGDLEGEKRKRVLELFSGVRLKVMFILGCTEQLTHWARKQDYAGAAWWSSSKYWFKSARWKTNQKNKVHMPRPLSVLFPSLSFPSGPHKWTDVFIWSSVKWQHPAEEGREHWASGQRKEIGNHLNMGGPLLVQWPWGRYLTLPNF